MSLSRCSVHQADIRSVMRFGCLATGLALALAEPLHRDVELLDGRVDVRLDYPAHDRLDLAPFRVRSHIWKNAEDDPARRARDGRHTHRAARTFFARAKRDRFETM